MDLQTYLDTMVQNNRNKSFENSPQITLGELIEQLENAGTKDDGEDKTVCFDFGSAIPTSLDSWRGSYNELALGYELSGYDGEGKYAESTAEKLLNELKNAIDKTYTGWKGGEYTMNENTPLWVANSGNADNTGIVGIIDKKYKIIIVTAYCEY